MSQKKKIRNADFAKATKAVLRVGSLFGDKIECENVAYQFMGGVVSIDGCRLIRGRMARSVCVEDTLIPFELMANGARFDKGELVRCSAREYIKAWLDVLDFGTEDGAAELCSSFQVLANCVLGVADGGVLSGAFIGAYGVFLVSLSRCLLSRGRMVFGFKSIAENVRLAKVQSDAAKMSSDIAMVIARGGKTKNDYLEIQRLQFFISCLEAKDDDCKPKITGEKGLLYQIWDWPGDIQGLKIPKDGGLTKDDCMGIGPLAGRWRRQAEKLGYIETRKNKPGAGGARMRKI